MLTQRSMLLCLVCLASLLAGPIFRPALSTQPVQSAPQALIRIPYADLAIGVPEEDLNVGGTDYADAGVVQILFGSASGLSGDYDQLFPRMIWITRNRWKKSIIFVKPWLSAT